MSLFANLFQNASETSSKLFSDSNTYRVGKAVHGSPHRITAAPSKRKEQHEGSSAVPERNPQASSAHTRDGPSCRATQPPRQNSPQIQPRNQTEIHVSEGEAGLDMYTARDAEGRKLAEDPNTHLKRSSNSEKHNEVEDPAATKRTVFVGNVPADTKKSSLKALFSKYGTIETVRLRSLPIDNESRMPRTQQIKAGKVNASGMSANAFIRFHSREDANAACAANMSIFQHHHLRVDIAAPRSADTPATAHYPPARSVFIGNLALDIQEDELIDVFGTGDEETHLRNSVEAVRVVRDGKTRIGKGIAYILFTSKVAALAALQLNGTECKGRKMRVNRVQKFHTAGSAQARAAKHSKKRPAPRRIDKKSDEFLGQKHSKAGVKKKKSTDAATAKTRALAMSKKGNARAVKRPAVAARKAKALLAAGKAPPPSAVAALKKKQKKEPQALK
eukprot:jgi/Ulvmu1/4888/UM020_0174.1